jgi:hypothetical protein
MLLGSSSTTLAQDTFPPTAIIDAEAQVPVRGDLVFRADRSADIGGRIVRYEWIRLSGSGGAIPLNEVFQFSQPLLLVPQSTTNPLAIGDHRFQLRVTDDSGNVSAPAIRIVRVFDNIPPTAVLDCPGPVTAGAAIVLRGQRSLDLDSAIVRYAWTRPGNAPIVTETAQITLDEGLSPGTHTFQLEVFDAAGNKSVPARCQIASRDTTLPVAILEAPQTVPFGGSFELSARKSADVGGRIVKYIWTRISGLGGNPAVAHPIESPSSELKVLQTKRSVMKPGVHRFQLVVIDNSGNRSVPANADVLVK